MVRGSAFASLATIARSSDNASKKRGEVLLFENGALHVRPVASYEEVLTVKRVALLVENPNTHAFDVQAFYTRRRDVSNGQLRVLSMQTLADSELAHYPLAQLRSRLAFGALLLGDYPLGDVQEGHDHLEQLVPVAELGVRVDQHPRALGGFRALDADREALDRQRGRDHPIDRVFVQWHLRAVLTDESPHRIVCFLAEHLLWFEHEEPRGSAVEHDDG